MNTLFQRRITGCEPYRVRNLIQDIMERIRIWNVLTEDDEYEFRLILNELIANGTIHGNKGQCTKGITATIQEVDPNTLCIIIQDDGLGFNHQDECASLYHRDISSFSERGRGLKLIRAICDDIQFNQTGNRICINKSIRQKSIIG